MSKKPVKGSHIGYQEKKKIEADLIAALEPSQMHKQKGLWRWKDFDKVNDATLAEKYNYKPEQIARFRTKELGLRLEFPASANRTNAELDRRLSNIMDVVTDHERIHSKVANELEGQKTYNKDFRNYLAKQARQIEELEKQSGKDGHAFANIKTDIKKMEGALDRHDKRLEKLYVSIQKVENTLNGLLEKLGEKPKSIFVDDKVMISPPPKR